jgi:hypothetical protein
MIINKERVMNLTMTFIDLFNICFSFFSQRGRAQQRSEAETAVALSWASSLC